MKKRSYDEAGQADLCARLAAQYQTEIVTTKQVLEFIKANNLPYPYFLMTDAYKVGWGKYRVSPKDGYIPKPVVMAIMNDGEKPEAKVKTLDDNFVPDRDNKYVSFGFFNDLRGIIDSRIFYPVYITGLSGNGKTLMVDQVCAASKRELIRVNITKETDEHDLIGSYELINGNTVWRDGPVLVAMRRGAILLLDETDYGSERLLCLQPILEGKGYFNKKKGEHITPAPGFNVMATANTKGKGSDDGRFIGANVLNEAFLERFAITVEQDYPNQQTELKILLKLFEELDTSPAMQAPQFAAHLAKWAEIIRKCYADGGVDEVISTRRLTHIAKAYSIFRNRRKAIEMCLNRFDNECKATYMDFYSKVDPDLDKKIVDGPVVPPPPTMAGMTNAQKKAAMLQGMQGTSAPAPAAPPPSAPITAAPAPVAGAAPVGGSVTIFGDARNVANVSAKFKTAVAVVRDRNTGGATVTSHGQSTTVLAGDIINDNGSLLESIVTKHSA